MTTAVRVAGARTFSSLRRHRNYRLFFTGQVVSVTGTWMQSVAQAWLIVQLTHSPLAVGFLAFCQFGPFGLGALFGGVLADRLDARKAVIATQSASMLLATVLAVLALTHVITAWQVYMIAALNGTVLILDQPARQAFTFQLVGRKELPNAVALNASVMNASRVIGPAIGGVVIATLGVGPCFGLNAMSFLAVLCGLLMMDTTKLVAPRRPGRRPAIFHGLGEGLRYSWATPPVRLALLLLLVVGTVSINFNVVLPVVVSQTLHAGPEEFGLLSACFGAGALSGGLITAWLGRASWQRLLVGALGLGAGELLLAPLSVLWACALVLYLTGVCFTLYAANTNAIVQLATPDALRGRVVSLYGFAFMGTAPVGGLLAGWLCEHGTSWALLVAGTVAVAATAVVWLMGRAGAYRTTAPAPLPVDSSEGAVGERQAG